MKKLLTVLLAIFLFLTPIATIQANAAFIDNEHWLECSADTVTGAYYANQPFVAMFYRPTCFNSGVRKVAVNGWMEDYGINVYGIDVDQYRIPGWVWQKLSSGSVTLPVICIVSNQTEYACFSAKDGMKQIQKYLHEHLGIYDEQEVDFARLNGQILSQYSCRASTAATLYLDTVETNPAVTAQAQAIVSGLSDDMLKLKAIYDWVTTTIFYDYGMLEGKSPRFVTAAYTLDFKRSVCEGFANLTAAMCQAVGIPCRVVTGFAAGVGTDSTIDSVWSCYENWLENGDLEAFQQEMAQYTNHAWNEAYVNGRWVTLDTTWGCNNDATLSDDGIYSLIRGTPTDDYFDLSVESLSQSHLTWTDYSTDLCLSPASANRVTLSGGLEAADTAQAEYALLAVYDDTGKMLFCQPTAPSPSGFSQTIDWPARAETAKLFLLDGTYQPVAAPYVGQNEFDHPA